MRLLFPPPSPSNPAKLTPYSAVWRTMTLTNSYADVIIIVGDQQSLQHRRKKSNQPRMGWAHRSALLLGIINICLPCMHHTHTQDQLQYCITHGCYPCYLSIWWYGLTVASVSLSPLLLYWYICDSNQSLNWFREQLSIASCLTVKIRFGIRIPFRFALRNLQTHGGKVIKADNLWYSWRKVQGV